MALPTVTAWLEGLTPAQYDKVWLIMFNEDRRLRHGFTSGHWRPKPARAISLVKELNRVQVPARLHDIRPDIWGPTDQGPK